MKVLICGSRRWHDRDAIVRRIDELEAGTVVIVGGASGADTIAELYAKARGLHTAVVKALWDVYAKGAGRLRNFAMLDLEPDLVIAFVQIGFSRGTYITIDEAKRRGIAVEVYYSDGNVEVMAAA